MKGKLFSCIIFLFFSLFCGILYAQEQEPLSLFEIDELIKKTEYEEALNQLNIYIDANPDQFDNAQIRINKIMDARIQYSKLAATLIDIIRNDPKNNKRIYEITSQLEKFEKHPSAKNLQFISDLKKSAEFNYFRSIFLEIQNNIAECIKNNDIIGAVTNAQDGFVKKEDDSKKNNPGDDELSILLYKESFYEQWEDEYPEFIGEVETIVNNLDSHLELLKDSEFFYNIGLSIDEFIKAVNNDQYVTASEKFKTVNANLKKYLNIMELILGDKADLESKISQFEPVDSNINEASFLAFLLRFLTGINSIEYSGVLTGVNILWNDFISDMNDSVFAMITNKYNLYKNGIDDLFVVNLENYADLERQLYSLGSEPYEKGFISTENPLDDYIMLSNYVSNLAYYVAAAENLLKVVNDNNNLQQSVIGKLKESNNLEDRFNYVKEIVEYSADLEKETGRRDVRENDYKEWSEDYAKSNYSSWDGLTDSYFVTIDEIYNKKADIIENSWAEIFSFYRNEGEAVYNTLYSYLGTAKKYREGIPAKISNDMADEFNIDIKKAIFYEQEITNSKTSKDSDKENAFSDLGIMYHYPDISINILNYIDKQVDVGIDFINGYLNKLDDNFNYFASWKDNKAVYDGFEDTKIFLQEQINKLKKLQLKELDGLSKDDYQKAENMITASEEARENADIKFEYAKESLKKEEFEKARKNLQAALTKYDESLNNQNNETLRSQWDKKLYDLGIEITRAENELVVREVRKLKNKARESYFNGKFDDAEKFLNQASAKWAITNITEDPEIINLRNFVDMALSMATGREILPSEPRYPEMSQLLNIAYINFEEGEYLLRKNDKDGAFNKFDEALESIRKVQYVYLYNQEAAILTLRIEKIRYPDKFNSKLNKINKAIDNMKRGVKNQNYSKQDYYDFLNFYSLNPNHPGLKELIYNVEIDMGIRQKPIDNSGKIKVKQYIREAKNIMRNAGNNSKELNRALDKVNEALALMPNSSEAMDLKDSITTKIGGNVSSVLSLSEEDRKLYQDAINFFQGNSLPRAKFIVDELLKKPENQNIKELKDLKKRIEAGM